MDSKICHSKTPGKACGKLKPISNFVKGRNLCKDCHNIETQESRMRFLTDKSSYAAYFPFTKIMKLGTTSRPNEALKTARQALVNYGYAREKGEIIWSCFDGDPYFEAWMQASFAMLFKPVYANTNYRKQTRHSEWFDIPQDEDKTKIRALLNRIKTGYHQWAHSLYDFKETCDGY